MSNTISVSAGQFEIREVDGKKELFDTSREVLITDLEYVKIVANHALDLWWSRLYIDVSGVGKLPVESAFNAMSAISALALNVDAAVVDIDDATIIIPAAQLRDKMNEFRVETKAAMDAWDFVIAGVKAATTVHDVLALNPHEPIANVQSPANVTGSRRFSGRR